MNHCSGYHLNITQSNYPGYKEMYGSYKENAEKWPLIRYILTALSAVQIYIFHIFTIVYSPFHGCIWNQHNDQLSVGLLAQLVERCTGIAEVMGSNPVQAWIFFRPYFYYCLSSVRYCEDHFHIHICCFCFNLLPITYLSKYLLPFISSR